MHNIILNDLPVLLLNTIVRIPKGKSKAVQLTNGQILKEEI